MAAIVNHEALSKATLALGVDNVDEIDTALEVFNSATLLKSIELVSTNANKTIDLGKDGDEVARTNFPLPVLKEKLNEGARELHNGAHFFRITGLDPSRYTDEENLILFLGAASYIADKRGIQNRKGDVIGRLYCMTRVSWVSRYYSAS